MKSKSYYKDEYEKDEIERLDDYDRAEFELLLHIAKSILANIPRKEITDYHINDAIGMAARRIHNVSDYLMELAELKLQYLLND